MGTFPPLRYARFLDFGEPWSIRSASLDFRNYSVPKDDPIHDAPNTRALEEAIYNQIARSHLVIIPSGMYASHSKWIQKEINAAKQYGKPILAVNPWEQERNADVVTSNPDDVAGWNKQPLINAINPRLSNSATTTCAVSRS